MKSREREMFLPFVDKSDEKRIEEEKTRPYPSWCVVEDETNQPVPLEGITSAFSSSACSCSLILPSHVGLESLRQQFLKDFHRNLSGQ
jgi:hypothetical protein